jgi:hypothetical protein
MVIEPVNFNPLNAELNPTFHLLALLGAHHILHVSGIRVKGMTWNFTLSILHAHICSHSRVQLRERRVKMKGHRYQNLILHSPAMSKIVVALTLEKTLY